MHGEHHRTRPHDVDGSEIGRGKGKADVENTIVTTEYVSMYFPKLGRKNARNFPEFHFSSIRIGFLASWYVGPSPPH